MTWPWICSQCVVFNKIPRLINAACYSADCRLFQNFDKHRFNLCHPWGARDGSWKVPGGYSTRPVSCSSVRICNTPFMMRCCVADTLSLIGISNAGYLISSSLATSWHSKTSKRLYCICEETKPCAQLCLQLFLKTC